MKNWTKISLAGPIIEIGGIGEIFCLLSPRKQKSFLTISNNFFSKTQGARLGAKVAPNKGVEQALSRYCKVVFKKWDLGFLISPETNGYKLVINSPENSAHFYCRWAYQKNGIYKRRSHEVEETTLTPYIWSVQIVFRLHPLIFCWLPVTCSVNFVIKLVISANITPIRKPPIETTKNEANARPICSAFTSPLSKLCIVRYKTTDAASNRKYVINQSSLSKYQEK